jgi:hypothetical protein
MASAVYSDYHRGRDMYAAIVGSICLGIVMGWLVRYFLDRFDRFDAKILGSVVSVIAGGVMVHVFGESNPVEQYARWYYFIGLLPGILLYPYVSQTKSPRP